MWGRDTWDPRKASAPAPVNTFELDRRIAETLASPTPLAPKCPVVHIEQLRAQRARRLAAQRRRPIGGAA